MEHANAIGTDPERYYDDLYPSVSRIDGQPALFGNRLHHEVIDDYEAAVAAQVVLDAEALAQELAPVEPEVPTAL
jgi:hypothetical protein